MKGTIFLATINDLISIFIPALTLSVSNNDEGVAELLLITTTRLILQYQAKACHLVERFIILPYDEIRFLS
jgi:hypothetical protein